MSVLQDLKFAARLLAKNRGFTIVAVMALALGIGVNNTFFTLVNAICLRGPIDDPSGLVHLGTRGPAGAQAGLSYADFEDARAATRTLGALAAYASAPVALADDERPAERVTAAYVTANAFDVVGVAPLAGRGFRPEDDRPGAAPVAILARTLWMSRYAGDQSPVGRSVRINGNPVTVVGIAREGFRFPNDASVWLPLASMPGIAAQPRNVRTLGVFGRLNDGTPIEQARAEIEGIMTRLAASHPTTNAGITATTVPINEPFTPRITDPAWLAFITAGALVLLIACANVANLLLARTLRRAGEMAVRASLGASRTRVVQQLLVESALLALAGGLLGVALSLAGVRLLSVMIPEGMLPSWMALRMDGPVLGMLVAVCVGTVFLFGLVPAVFASKADPGRLLSGRGATGVAGLGARRWTTVFLTAEFALTFVLLAALALEVRSFFETQRRDRVIETAGLLTASVTLPPQRYSTPDARNAFYDRLTEAFEGAGVAAVSLASALPFNSAARRSLLVDGRPPVPGRPLPSVWMVGVAPRYFDSVGVRIGDGRQFTASDGRPGQAAAIVNQRLAATFFPDEDAIGRRIQLPMDAPGATAEWLTIVGVAPTIQQSPNPDPAPIVYVPLRSLAPQTVALLVRDAPGSQTTASVLRDRVRGLDADLPLSRVLSMEQALTDAGWNGRMASALIRTIATIGLFLALVGLYAVTTFSVTSRRREIGVRIAVGARSVSVGWLVMRRALAHLGLGVLAGVGCTLAWDRLLSTGTSRMAEPVALLAVAALIGTIGVAASLVPAWRAMRTDPVAALRTE
jgi:predicted permease